jgi:hypothetical protein
MLANSMLGCLQIALDPEAITVSPAVYFPEVLELARQSINESVKHLERGEFRRLLLPHYEQRQVQNLTSLVFCVTQPVQRAAVGTVHGAL